MAKKRLAYALSAVALTMGAGIVVPISSFAEEKTLESCEGIEDCAFVTSTAELSSAFTARSSTVIIGSSFELTTDVRTAADMELYLNDYTITTNGWSIINVNGDLTIYAGKDGKIEETGGVYAPLYVYNNTIMKSGTIKAAGAAVSTYYGTGLFTFNGGVIEGGSDSATTTMVGDGAKMIMNDGVISADTWGVSVFKDSTFEMNGGTINVSSNDGIGVSGNGSMSGYNEGTNAILSLNAGTINSGDLGVYAPQADGITTLGEGLAINAGKCGVEVRAGELYVRGATINVDADAGYRFDPNGSGSTASGVGIAVAQHTTQQRIVASISDGVFTAPVAFAEANPQQNGDEAVAKVELSITGGDFIATNGAPIVASEDVTRFITGGTYSKIPRDEENEQKVYVANGYDVYSYGNTYVVDESSVAYQGGELFLMNGDSEELDLGEIGNRYATLSLSGDEIATTEGRVITATTDGKSTLVINYNSQIHPMTTSVPLVVYSIGIDEHDVIEGEDRDEVADFTATQVKNLINSGEESNNSLQLYPSFNDETGEMVGSGIDRLKDALKEGGELYTSLDALDLYEDYWAGEEGMNVIGEHLGENEGIAMVYRVSLGLFANNDYGLLGEVTDLNGLGIEFDLEIPEDYREAPEGYTREFSVLRFHRGVWDRPEFTKEEDVLKTSSSIFSTYVIAYTDTENVANPVNPLGSGTETNNSTSKTTTPGTGTVTVAGASAISAGFITIIAVGILTSITSFAYLVRHK